MNKKVEVEICPRCLKNPLHPVKVRNSLSRKDNKTYICNVCGDEEALVDISRKVKVHKPFPTPDESGSDAWFWGDDFLENN